jgi:exo-beta-1,3-glucanase (GH17 family)
VFHHSIDLTVTLLVHRICEPRIPLHSLSGIRAPFRKSILHQPLAQHTSPDENSIAKMVCKSFAAAFFAAGLIASVSASNVHNHHANLHHKKNAPVYDAAPSSTACGCTTYTTTWYGEATLVPDATTKTSTAAPATSAAPTTTSTSSEAAAATPTSTWSAPASTYEAPASTYVAPAPTQAAPSPVQKQDGGIIGGIIGGVFGAATSAVGAVASAAADVTSGVSAAIGANGNKWAITYTPYNADGTCKSAASVDADIAVIKGKGFTSVRLYSTDCSGLVNAGNAAKAHGLKIIVGVWLDGAGVAAAKAQVDVVVGWGPGNWDNVEMVVVGNEAIFSGHIDAGGLAQLVIDARASLRAAGYSGPVTTTETVANVQANAGVLCSAIDVVGANIHPYFNGAIAAAGAGVFVKSQLDSLANVCPGKQAYNLETGWPNGGNANGDAIAGWAEQKLAIASISLAVGAQSTFFSFENDMWKAPGSLGVEQHWGCADLF